MSDREIRHSGHMSDTEALMWSMEEDPWLSSAMGSVFLLDTAPDLDRLRRQMDEASRTFLRLRERVDEGVNLTTPRWVIDEDFDVDDHVTELELEEPGDVPALLQAAADLISAPFDRAKPLWHFAAVSGSGPVAGALIIKMHHSVSDGIGAVRLAEMYMDLERDPAHRLDDDRELPEPPEPGEHGVRDDVSHIARRQLGLARRLAGEVALWGADRERVRQRVGDLTAAARSLVGPSGGGGDEGGSALWSERSGRRSLEVFEFGLDEVKEGAHALGGTVNDLFVTGAVMAAAAYHDRRGAEIERFNLSFVLSTRNDHAAGGNSFAPIPFSVDAAVRPAAETFADVKAHLATTREDAERGTGELMELAAGFMSTLPSSMLSRVGRARAAKLDFATSNLRAAPFTIYVAGAEITHMYPVGPLVGTAFNLTAMSYNGQLYFGLFVDPEAVDDTVELRHDLVAAYRELLESSN